MAKVSALMWHCTELRKVTSSTDVNARDDLNRHGRLRSGATQGCQPWGMEVEIDLTGVKAAAKRYK
jgi:hypothetical protein